MNLRKYLLIFAATTNLSAPAHAWGFLVPYAEQIAPYVIGSWQILSGIARNLAEAVATHPRNQPANMPY